MPQSILDHRNSQIEQILVSNFISKLQTRTYLMDSKAVLIFSDSAIASGDQLEAALSKF